MDIIDNKHHIVIFLVIITLVYLIFIYDPKTEEYSQGALTQLYAKGPQDLYLTTNTEKYLHPYYHGYGTWPRHSWYSRYTPFAWNNPTRFHGYRSGYGLYNPYFANYFYPRVTYY